MQTIGRKHFKYHEGSGLAAEAKGVADDCDAGKRHAGGCDHGAEHKPGEKVEEGRLIEPAFFNL